MPNALIIEDEAPAARRLQSLLQEVAPQWQIMEVIDNIEDTVGWLKSHQMPQLIFMDIQLADGLSFSIFEQVTIKTPIIFTTAYDEYAIKAFQVNSIDYLLKPIDKDKLQKSIKKFEELHQKQELTTPNIEQLLHFLQDKSQDYKNRFLVKMGERLIPIEQQEIAYFMAEDKIVLLVTHQNKKFAIDYTLDRLENLLNPTYFFRLNRKFFVRFDAIQQIHSYFNGKLKIDILPNPNTDVVVSRDKSSSFKDWLDG